MFMQEVDAIEKYADLSILLHRYHSGFSFQEHLRIRMDTTICKLKFSQHQSSWVSCCLSIPALLLVLRITVRSIRRLLNWPLMSTIVKINCQAETTLGMTLSRSLKDVPLWVYINWQFSGKGSQYEPLWRNLRFAILKVCRRRWLSID